MSGPDETLGHEYAAVRREAEVMAGARGDLAQRSMVYHHLYRHSEGNHAFPLLAAHGALWGKGYFALGMKVGRALSLLDIHRPEQRREQLESLAAFADAFRDINRRVCIEVYTAYHFTAKHGDSLDADRRIDPVLLEHLNRCHHATRNERSLSRGERAALFSAFFRWEQREVVGPSVDAAVKAFGWSTVRAMAMRPNIRFSYIPRRDVLRFRNFADIDERIEKGLLAYDIAEREGFLRVEETLAQYGVLPTDYLKSAEAFFESVRARLLRPTAAFSAARAWARNGPAVA